MKLNKFVNANSQRLQVYGLIGEYVHVSLPFFFVKGTLEVVFTILFIINRQCRCWLRILDLWKQTQHSFQIHHDLSVVSIQYGTFWNFQQTQSI